MDLLSLQLALFLILSPLAIAIHPYCEIFQRIEDSNASCIRLNVNQSRELNDTAAHSPGCLWEWRAFICWPSAAVGEMVSRPCPSFWDPPLAKRNFTGVVYRNCTEHGWSKLISDVNETCELLRKNSSKPNDNLMSYYFNIKNGYTAGYMTSMIALVTAIIIFTAFRKFHCTRNYIHLNLFMSFILRATSVLTKDAILFSSSSINHCFISTVTCKAAITFLHYCILTNFSWLLVEGLYLQTLLSLTFVSNKKYFWSYCLIGWGAPTILVVIWIVVKLNMENIGCWDGNENKYIWWIIRGAILLAVLINFLIFLNIIRILVQKLRSPDVGGNSSTHFVLTKSTLLLIPLFGVHYIVCACLPDNVAEDLRILIELGIGSFQGFIVALLYCFLNGEVLAELRKCLRGRWPKRDLPFKTRHKGNLSTESSGTADTTQISLMDKLSPKRRRSDRESSFQQI
ncbi:vasoactive intestinal polypeptide receptor 1-like isoform X2 [Stegostoma tigrinum]|uniref:vasoactive intestinal polypeptide receptor 1-like isoform X2 n=1 Tax=Stegostoma tigrinum TaxID=3053191 RepID=UPI0028700BD3|nr:vasoactive intestinal polypeptide receptor 1-like isoform X2 [Stegostoma tigrinum]